jgi:amino acid adenylation domain-containing protein
VDRPHPAQPHGKVDTALLTHDTTTVHEAIERWALRSPGTVAVRDGQTVLTYADLDARAAGLAARIESLGQRPERRIGIVSDRGAGFIVAALAAIKAGAAYVPLDPSYPADALERMCRAARVNVILTTPGAGRFSTPCDVAVLPIDGAEPVSGKPGADGRLMYLIFTSGSTGEPKCVAVSHQDVLALSAGDPRLAVAPGDTVAHLAPVAFDASIFEIWTALIHGATVDVYPPGQLSADSLGGYLRATRPDWLFLTTGLFHAMVDHDLDALADARRIITGGDVLSPQHVRHAAAVTEVYAAYGPTETTVFASLHHIEAAEVHDRVPLGTPLTDMELAVLDDRLRTLPDGTVGELFIRGAGLSRGYDGSPARTAERFLPHPAPAFPGERMYRTGDLGSASDGVFDFHGRVDRQVKIRGYRIELGEVEAALNAHPDVAAGTVVAREAAGGKRLAVYVAPSAGGALTPAQIKAWLTDRLPPFMVPGTVAVLDAMPLDRNGKFDRTALPSPWESREAFGPGPYRAPSTPLEQDVANLFADTLGLDRIGVDDDFFVMGGDSLRSVDLLAGLSALGLRLSAREFFNGPTVAQVVTGSEARRAPELVG